MMFGASVAIVAQNSDYQSCMNRKDYNGAVVALTPLLKKLPTSDLFYKRALAYEALGNLVFAIQDCSSAIELDKNNKQAYLLRGKLKMKYNDPTYLADFTQAGETGRDYLENAQKANYETEIEPAILSDVDFNIPKTKNANSNTFVLIIANEEYEEPNISSVQFAQRDGEIFRKYCINTLGVPEENIRFRLNATINQMRSEMKWVQNVSSAYGVKSNFIIYYSGHGVPDEQTQRAYLLPSDGFANDIGSAYPLSTFYGQLSELSSESVVVFLDACFSGAKRGNGMLTASRGVAIKPKKENIGGNLIVFAASQGDETAYPYDEERHGLFTFFILKKLQESNGEASLSELVSYVTEKVRQTSIIQNNRNQTPSISISPSLGNSWKNIKLK